MVIFYDNAIAQMAVTISSVKLYSYSLPSGVSLKLKAHPRHKQLLIFKLKRCVKQSYKAL